MRFPEAQCLDVTCKTNNQNLPLTCTTCADSEVKNVMTQTSFLTSEKEVACVFTIFNRIFACNSLFEISVYFRQRL